MSFQDRPDIYDPWLIEHTRSQKVYQRCQWCAVKRADIHHFSSKKQAKKFCQQNPDWVVSEYHGYNHIR